jgi:hypothetical protein
MARKLVFFALLAVTLGIGFRASAEERYCTDTHARILRVEMYPCVPNVEGMAWRMKEIRGRMSRSQSADSDEQG